MAKVRERLRKEKSIVVLVVLFFFCLLLSLLHRQAAKKDERSFLENITISLVAPFQYLGSRAKNALLDTLDSLKKLRSLEEENRELRLKVARLEADRKRLEEYFLEAKRLRQLLDLKVESSSKVVCAHVIASNASDWFKIITIDRGFRDGVKPQSVVINAQGVIGQVYKTSPHSANVLLIIDQRSGVGAMVQRTRYMGIIKGEGENGCLMKYLPREADIRKGDTIITSGQGRVYPKGLLIGRVVKVWTDEYNSTKQARVEPVADFRRLEEVLVINREQ